MKLDAILFAIGFGLACIKLILSGNTILGLHMGNFTAGDFGVMVGALGSIHVASKHSDNLAGKRDNNDDKN